MAHKWFHRDRRVLSTPECQSASEDNSSRAVLFAGVSTQLVDLKYTVFVFGLEKLYLPYFGLLWYYSILHFPSLSAYIGLLSYCHCVTHILSYDPTCFFSPAQVMQMVDISQPLYGQLRKVKGTENENANVTTSTQQTQKPVSHVTVRIAFGYDTCI